MPMSPRLRRIVAAGLGALLVSAIGATSAEAGGQHSPSHPPSPRPVAVRLISFNDLHGNLVPPAGSSGRVFLDNGSTVDAGGAAYLATHMRQLRSQVKNSVVVSAGDAIGASPLNSALFHDEPTIDVVNRLGLAGMAVGNHEFDEGYAELMRIQHGGCHPVDGCQFEKTFRGANFPILGANVTFAKNGRPALRPFTIVRSGGMRIGIIGVTLRGLPEVVVPSAVQGLRFGDEVKAIDQTSRLLQRLGVKSQIVVMHQGDETGNGGPDACNDVQGPAMEIAKRATSNVDAFFLGHTHQQYNCMVTDPAGKPRPVIQGLSFGRLLSVIDVKIDPRSKDVIRSATSTANNPVAHNEIVTRDVEPDPAVQAIVDESVTKSAPLANRRVGTITADLIAPRNMPKDPNASGETALGDVIADAQLAGTTANGAQIAITNPGGIRTDLLYASSSAGEGDGVVTYGEAFAVQPFSNIMQTITMTGQQLDAVLEQQWQPQADGTTTVRILQISASLHYTMTLSNSIGDRVSELELNGQPIDPAGTYRVSVNNFLAAGGDGFTVFTQGTDLTGGPIDLDAFTEYLTDQSPVSPPPLDRIVLG
jgi:5'-nucleotidase